MEYTVVIPCYNEEGAIEDAVLELLSILEGQSAEIIIVDDGSTDGSGAALDRLQQEAPAIKVLRHTENRGYGASLKSGIRAAVTELIVITDADGTYPNERIPELVSLCADQDMVIGVRTGANVTYSKLRAIPKIFMRRWVSWLARRHVPDFNSGLRVFRKSVAEQFFGVLSDQFSFTTSITLAMLTTHRPVRFEPIDYHHRIGSSKIKPIRDTLRFLALILRTGVYFAPLRAFAPLFGMLFFLTIISTLIDIFLLANLTDKTVLLFLFALNVAMFALLADMIDKRLA